MVSYSVMSDSSPDWPAAAARFSASLPIERFERSVVSFLEERRDEPWVVACSGGADSTCLALAAWGSLGEHSGSLRLAHFNHGLRGEDSDLDQSFVEKMAVGLGVSFEVGCTTKRSGEPSEAVLREERHAFFSEVCSKSGSTVLLLGHHRNDVAETMLMRLTRGSGSDGLAAPRPIHLVRGVWRVRPLLSLSRTEIHAVLREAGIRWREDASNADSGPFRNRVRLEVLPSLAKVAPSDALSGFARSRDLLEEDTGALDGWANEKFPDLVIENGSLDAPTLRGLPKALTRRVLRKWLAAGGAADALSARAFDDLLLHVSMGQRAKVSLARDRWVQVDEMAVSFLEESFSAKGWGPCSLPTGGSLFLPSSGILQMKEPLGGDEARRILAGVGVKESREVLLDADSLEGPLSVRTWLPGDRFVPLGAPGSRKLQDLFTDRKVPATRRDRLPVILSGTSQIAWCPGLPPAERCRVTIHSRDVLRLTYMDPEAL